MVCASLLFGSCASDSGYVTYQTTAQEGLSTTPVIFELPEQVTDTLIKNVFIRLRNDNTYQFANIFLIASLTAGGELVTQDTLEYAMAAPDGKWLGTGFTEVKESKLWWKEGAATTRTACRISLCHHHQNARSCQGERERENRRAFCRSHSLDGATFTQLRCVWDDVAAVA